MPKIRLPFADKANNRSYLNTADYLLLNAYIEHGAHELAAVKRPGWKLKKETSTLVTIGRGFTYSAPHSLFYAVIGDALFSIDTTLGTVIEISRKSITLASWAAGVATYTCVGHGFTATTQKVKTSGILGAGYNGVFTVLGTPTVDTFTASIAVDPVYVSVTNAKASPIITETGKVYFEQTRNGANQVTMLQIPKTSTTASQLFMIAAGGVVTRVVDIDLPVDLIGAPVSIDRYLFVLSAAKFEVYNMDLEAPTSINSLGVVAADAFADSAVTLAKQNNHVVCLKEYSIEFFYDATIAAPASPLAKIPQQTLTIGCASAASVVQAGQRIIWLSRDQNGGLAVHAMTNGQPQKVSTPFIDRILASMESFVFSDKVESTYISNEGHEFYVLTIEGVAGSNQAIFGIGTFGLSVFGLGGTLNTYKRTLVLDITTGEWAEWSSYNPTTLQQEAFFATHAVSGPHASNAQDFTNTLIMEKATGNIYEMSPAPVGVNYAPTYKDGSRDITVTIVMNSVDGGTRNRKRCNSMEILGDVVASTLNVSYSDDDYATFSTPRTIALSGRARLLNMGMFRRRAYKFTHAADTPLRIAGIELDVEQMGS